MNFLSQMGCFLMGTGTKHCTYHSATDGLMVFSILTLGKTTNKTGLAGGYQFRGRWYGLLIIYGNMQRSAVNEH